MAGETRREATLGILSYLLLGAALGAALLVGLLVLGFEAVGDLYGGALHAAIDTTEAQRTVLFVFFTVAPLIAILVAIVLGMRAAASGERIGGTAAATTMYGLPILWVNVVAALLLATALLDWIDDGDNFGDVLDMVLESIVFLLFETFAVIGFAALAAGIARDAFRGGDMMAMAASEPVYEAVPVRSSTPPAITALPEVPEPREEEPAPAVEHSGPAAGGPRLEAFPISCPRCAARFEVSGERPLRIECPECGKTGTIR